MSRKAAAGKGKGGNHETPTPGPETLPRPRGAARAEKAGIVYLKLSELFLFKGHPFSVWSDAEVNELLRRLLCIFPFFKRRLT